MTKQKLAHTHSQLYFVTSSDSDISGPKLKKKRKKKMNTDLSRFIQEMLDYLEWSLIA